MTTPTFIYVEDYLEFIGGYRDATGRRLGIFETVPSPISLARYDVTIVDSMGAQTAEANQPYTDKQAALAVRIVDKYRRQLSNLTPAIIVPEKLDQFRMGVRVIDRTKKIYIEDGKLVAKFPYDTKLIDLIKKQVKEGNGEGSFDNDHKFWKLALTEHMLNWCVTIGSSNDFEISDEVHDLYAKMLEVENTPYQIELDIVGNTPVISNVPIGMLEYINDNLGGISLNNLLVLVDNSEVLGYTVSNTVKEVIKTQYPDKWKMICQRKINLAKLEDSAMEQAVEYARLVNRLPVYVYDNGLPKKNTDEIIYLNRGMGYNIAPRLLITHTSLMIGSRKESWILNSEKIITIE